ncbi:MAG: hypothetical protein AAF616_01330 [Bacteroidota bacterium]
MKKLLFIASAILLLWSCGDDEAPNFSLAQFIEDQGQLSVKDSSIIACAAGATDSVRVFFYPEPGFEDFRLWKLEGLGSDPSDFKNYVPLVAPTFDVFNGYLRYFFLTEEEGGTWVTVTGKDQTTLTIAQPILLKQSSFPTENSPDALTIDQSEDLAPRFTWEPGNYPGTIIFFQVVADGDRNLLSGTYTVDQTWQFYDLINVVLNIRDVTPIPQLNPKSDYSFTLMGVTRDNWVNVFMEVPFSTP